MHCGDQRTRAHPGIGTDPHHHAGQLLGIGAIGQESAGTELHIQHQRAGALGDLLAHDGRRDHRDRRDRPGDVPQRVERPVGGREVGAGGADHGAGVGQDAAHLVAVEVGPPAGDGLEFVQRAAGVAEPAPRQLRHGDVVGREKRREDQRDRIAHPAGRMLVDGRHRAAAAGQPGQVQSAPRVNHRGGPSGDLPIIQPAEIDRHRERGHLLRSDLPAGERVDDPGDLIVVKLPPVPLGLDDPHRVMAPSAGVLRVRAPCAGVPRAGALRVVAGVTGGHVRSPGPNASGSNSPRRTGPRAPCTIRSGPPCSWSNCRQRPHGARGSPVWATTTSSSSRPPPVRKRSETSEHSAHNVRPYEAFSTLHPVTIRTSASPAGGVAEMGAAPEAVRSGAGVAADARQPRAGAGTSAAPSGRAAPSSSSNILGSFSCSSPGPAAGAAPGSSIRLSAEFRTGGTATAAAPTPRPE